jgi:hypothetical protein
MARTQPHFEYHVREAVRAKRRFGIWTAVLVMALAVVVGLQFHGSHAAQSLTVSGRVVNITNGAGIPNVHINICGAGVAVTSSGGYWSYPGIEPGQSYCVQYLSGAPKYLAGPYAVDNNPDVGQNPAYLNQVAGMDCFGDSKCSRAERQWDRGEDSGFDFAFINKSGILGSAEKGIGVRAYVLAAAKTPSNVALAASATGPSVPTNFQATVDSDNAVVTLTWTPSTAANGIKGYIIQRSLDGTTWSTLSGSVTGDSYTDKTASFGINYFYQINAVDEAGNMSGWTGTEAQTPGFSNNSQSTASGSSTTTSYTSDDGLVSVTVPPGAITQDADCSVDTLKLTSEDSAPSNPGFSLVMGPYQFVCKTQGGQEIPPSAQAVTWVFQVNSRLGKKVNPQVDSYGSNGSTTLVPGPYSVSAGTITVSETNPDVELIVMAAAAQPFVPTNFVIAVFLLILILAGIAVLIFRQQEKISYHDYLRNKYTNL